MKKIRLFEIALISILFTCLIKSAYSQTNTDADWKMDVKDSTEYDIDFISYWKYVKPYSLLITNDSIIVNNNRNDPILIPTDLIINQENYYESNINDTVYKLIVKRVNYTNIEYSIEGKLKNESVFTREGIAILESSFHLGAEGVYEKSEDEIYGMNDYNIKINEQGEIKLLVPVGTDEIIDYVEQQGESKIYLSFKKIEKK